jgi:heme-degrading monooxygenase HmoA
MPRGVYLVFTNPVAPDRREEYEAFYRDVHAPEVAASPGFGTFRRFRRSEAQPAVGAISAMAGLTIYELESDDLSETFRQLDERRATGGFTPGPAIQKGTATYGVFEELPSERPPADLASSTAVYVVLTNPISQDRREEYEQYYQDVHAPEVCQSPGFTSFRRFRLTNAQDPVGPVADRQYLTIYELASDDLGETFRKHAERRDSGQLTPSTSIARDTSTYGVYQRLAGA